MGKSPRRVPGRRLMLEPLESRRLLAGDTCVADDQCADVQVITTAEVDLRDPRFSVPAFISTEILPAAASPAVDERIELRPDAVLSPLLAPAAVSAPPAYLPAGSVPVEPAFETPEPAADMRLRVRLTASRGPLFPRFANADESPLRLLSRQDFGDGTTVIADFDGDGIEDLALRVDDHWLIDLDHNGRWDEDAHARFEDLRHCRDCYGAEFAWVALPPRTAHDARSTVAEQAAPNGQRSPKSSFAETVEDDDPATETQSTQTTQRAAAPLRRMASGQRKGAR